MTTLPLTHDSLLLSYCCRSEYLWICFSVPISTDFCRWTFLENWRRCQVMHAIIFSPWFFWLQTSMSPLTPTSASFRTRISLCPLPRGGGLLPPEPDLLRCQPSGSPPGSPRLPSQVPPPSVPVGNENSRLPSQNLLGVGADGRRGRRWSFDRSRFHFFWDFSRT